MKFLTTANPNNNSKHCYFLFDLSKQNIEDILEERSRLFRFPKNSIDAVELVSRFKNFSIHRIEPKLVYGLSDKDFHTLDDGGFIVVSDSFNMNDESKIWGNYCCYMSMGVLGISFKIYLLNNYSEWDTNNLDYLALKDLI